jgi:hypothetical protein
MIVFALEFGGWLISGYPIYTVCTGLYENILEVGNTKNLTFFRRGTTIETKPLNFIKMSEMYKRTLKVDNETAKRLYNDTLNLGKSISKFITSLKTSPLTGLKNIQPPAP